MLRERFISVFSFFHIVELYILQELKEITTLKRSYVCLSFLRFNLIYCSQNEARAYFGNSGVQQQQKVFKYQINHIGFTMVRRVKFREIIRRTYVAF